MKPTNITTLPDNPEHERLRRMKRYTIMMAIRMLCFILLLFTTGVWQFIFGMGAIFLPYLAVMVANSVDQRTFTTQSPTRELEPGSFYVHDKPKDRE